ncbi:MAG: methyltransferase domain-containing protein [Gemmatimonadaceae bacterium]
MDERPDWYQRWVAGRQRLIERALDEVPYARDGVLLDVAAGDAGYSRLVAEHTGTRLVAQDFSETECAAVRRSGAATVRGDVRRLGFADACADVTVAFEIVEHLSKRDATAMFEELHRVTKPGGTLLLSTPNRYAIESFKGLAHYLRDGTVWNARDETHIRLYSRRELLKALRPYFDVRRTYGYYLLEAGERALPFSHTVTTNPLLSNLCFILCVVATPRALVGAKAALGRPRELALQR